MQRTTLFTQLILTLLVYTSAIAGPEDWRIALCVSEDPSQQLNVSWRTDARLDTPEVRLHVNTPLAKFHRNPARIITAKPEEVLLADSTMVYAYSAEMTELKPGETYLYQVGGGESWSEWFTFQTARESDDDFRFLYFGDPQNGLLSHVSRSFRAGYSAAPDAAFITMAGDLVSVPGIDQQWEDFFHAGAWIFAQKPHAPVIGNHAYYVNSKWSKNYSPQWRPHFTLPENGIPSLPETNYFFHYQDLLFVVLNGNEQLAEQAIWLDETLTREKASWIVLSMHQPLYSTTEGRDGSKRRGHFLAIIDKHQVDLVLQGHDHTFGRTFPLKDNVRSKRREKGTVYINSVSGSKQYDLGPAMNELFAITGSDTQYYHVIEVQKKRMVLLSYSVDNVLVDKCVISPAKRK